MMTSNVSSTGVATMQLLPFVSTKSCRVISFWSTWCSRNGRISAWPMIGSSGEPQVSATQCTTPETKSASTKPNMKALTTSQG